MVIPTSMYATSLCFEAVKPPALPSLFLVSNVSYGLPSAALGGVATMLPGFPSTTGAGNAATKPAKRTKKAITALESMGDKADEDRGIRF